MQSINHSNSQSSESRKCKVHNTYGQEFPSWIATTEWMSKFYIDTMDPIGSSHSEGIRLISLGDIFTSTSQHISELGSFGTKENRTKPWLLGSPVLKLGQKPYSILKSHVDVSGPKSSGNVHVSTDKWLRAVNFADYEIVVLLAHEHLPHNSPVRQLRKAVYLNIDLLNECKMLLNGKSIDAGFCIPLWSVLLEDIDAVLSNIEGTWKMAVLSGADMGECLDDRMLAVRKAATLNMVKEVPVVWLRGSGHPLEVVASVVTGGIDLFSGNFVEKLADDKLSLVGQWHLVANDSMAQGEGVPLDVLSSVIVSSNAMSNRPLLEKCSCYTCTKFCRGYLHHLLVVEELLGTMLLTIHNMHQYGLLFVEIRKHIVAGDFDSWAKKFSNSFLWPEGYREEARIVKSEFEETTKNVDPPEE